MRDSARTFRPVQFSARTSWDTAETAWARALTMRRQLGLPIHDLTIANPTQCGFAYDEQLVDALQQPAAMKYTPDPRGLPAARDAIHIYYRDHCDELAVTTSLELSPQQIVLTTSTSEAYSFLFRLLCDPEDEVLIAQPSYPLFGFLAALDDVKLVPYPLFYDHGWYLDLHGLRLKISARTRAIVVVHPNNPTGHFTHEADRKALEAVCAEFGLALIVDEVFLDYGLKETSPSFVCGAHPVLTFVLSGLSKIAALPQMKLSWIAACGPKEELIKALERLEVIADTFLSVSAPLQLALPSWLQNRNSIQQQIRTRTSDNLRILDGLLKDVPLLERLAVEGGWYAILRTPALRDGEEAALWLLEEGGISRASRKFFRDARR